MLIVDIEMPRNCLQCCLRYDCDPYKLWLKSTNPKPPERKDHLDKCMIKGEVANESMV